MWLRKGKKNHNNNTNHSLQDSDLDGVFFFSSFWPQGSFPPSLNYRLLLRRRSQMQVETDVKHVFYQTLSFICPGLYVIGCEWLTVYNMLNFSSNIYIKKCITTIRAVDYCNHAIIFAAVRAMEFQIPVDYGSSSLGGNMTCSQKWKKCELFCLKDRPAIWQSDHYFCCFFFLKESTTWRYSGMKSWGYLAALMKMNLR